MKLAFNVVSDMSTKVGFTSVIGKNKHKPDFFLRFVHYIENLIIFFAYLHDSFCQCHLKLNN